jgi:hypothetical protein
MKVAKKHTLVDVEQMTNSLVHAWQSLLGKVPSKEQLAMILAQNALETNHRKAMFNYNVGNIMHMGDNFDYFENQDSYAGKSFTAKFRSYSSLDDGVLDYLKLLYKGYPQAFTASQTGDPKAFAQSLIANPQRQYYDPHVQKQYASGMTSLYQQYLKSPELASIQSKPSRSGILQKLLEKYKGKESELIAKLFHPKTKPLVQPTQPVSNIDGLLDSYLQKTIAAKKRSYKTLPNNHLLIQVKSADYVNAVEFARILCLALDEELSANAYTHTDGNKVEIECSIHGPPIDCLATVEQLSSFLTETFHDATIKIGGIKVETQCFADKMSSCREMDLKSAESQYRKFLIKFAKESK